MLQTIKLMKLRVKEFIQFFADFTSILERNNPEALKIKEQLKPVVDELEKIKVIDGTDKGSDISEELKLIDERRDDDITGIRIVVEGYTYYYEEKTRKAAELLLNIIDNYGPSIARQNYPTETASINGIMEKFKSDDECKNALSLLNLNNWTVKLDEENTLFNQRYLDRVDEKAKQSEEKIKELRKSTTDYYYELRDHLNSHSTLNKGSYKPVMDKLNKLIEEYNGIVNRRKGGKSSEEDKGEE